MRTRFLYVIGQLRGGGSERNLVSLLEALDRDCYHTAVAVWNLVETDVYVPRVRELQVPIYDFPKHFSSLAKLRALQRLAHQLDPEVIQSHSFFTNFAAYWCARKIRAVSLGVLHCQPSYLTDIGFLLRGLSARRPSHQIWNSQSAVRDAQQSGFKTPAHIYVVRNGLDLQQFAFAPYEISEPVQILGMGSLFPVKRWEKLIAAASELARRGYDFRIQIIGDGPLREQLIQTAQEAGVASKVHFPGFLSNVAELLAQSAFLVHVSASEGCPNAVMEAMACGRAVVATDVGDVPELVVEGKTGFVVPLDDDAALVDRMEKLLQDSRLCRTMGEAGRSKAEQEFGLERLIAKTFAAYRAAGWRG